MGEEVWASFKRKAQGILEAAPQQQAPNAVRLNLVRLYLCIEVVRHLKAPSRGASSAWGRSSPQPPAPVPMETFHGDPGMNIIFVGDWPPPAHWHAGNGLSIPRAAQGEEPFRVYPDYLRERVSILFELLLGGSVEARLGRPMGLSAEEVDCHCPTSTQESTDGSHCPVCLEAFVAGDLVRKFPCSHAFHRECCEAWLATADTCPTCRFKIQRS